MRTTPTHQKASLALLRSPQREPQNEGEGNMAGPRTTGDLPQHPGLGAHTSVAQVRREAGSLENPLG